MISYGIYIYIHTYNIYFMVIPSSGILQMQWEKKNEAWNSSRDRAFQVAWTRCCRRPVAMPHLVIKCGQNCRTWAIDIADLPMKIMIFCSYFSLPEGIHFK